MRGDAARPLGIIVALLCAGWMLTVLWEISRVVKHRSLLTSADAWANAVDSGVLAFTSIFAVFAMLAVSLAAVAVAITALLGFASVDRWGLLTAAIFVVTLALHWAGAPRASSWLEFAQAAALSLVCAASGIVTGLRLLPGRRERPIQPSHGASPTPSTPAAAG